jgi:uncharacterized protein YbjT (DUF2867 family)
MSGPATGGVGRRVVRSFLERRRFGLDEEEGGEVVMAMR